MSAQVALVTGGASGIGAATVTRLQHAGLLVAVLDRSPAPAADRCYEVDVTDHAAVADAVRSVVADLGRVDHAVTAAGVYEGAALEALDVPRWRRMLAVHVGGTVAVWRAVLPHLLARGGGSLCAVGSELGLAGDPNAAHYAAAKGAIHALAKSVAVEVAPRGVRINVVAPGPTDTPLLRDDPLADDYAAAIPLRRLISPDEIAAAICFVLLEPTNLVGQVVSPNGGAVL